MMLVNFIAFHPWVPIGVVALGLPLGMLVQIRRERRRNRWKDAQEDMNRELAAAWRELDQALRYSVAAAKRCGCSACQDILRQAGEG